MTDFETLLLSEQRNPNAAIVEFFLSSYDSENIIVLVEGDDDAIFYVDFINSYTPAESKFYFPCGGKETALALRDFLRLYDPRPEPKKILVLVDRDFDDFLGRQRPRTFQTDVYSIENYFCCAGYFEFILRKYTVGRIKNKLVDTLASRFDQIFLDAIPFMIVPMSIACALRESRANIDLDKMSCSDFLNIDYKKNCLVPRRTSRSATFHQIITASGARLDCAAVRRFASIFSRTPFNKWLRGKYGLQLVRLVLKLLCHEHKGCGDTLKQLGVHFGSGALGHSKMFLGDIPSLAAYYEAQ